VYLYHTEIYRRKACLSARNPAALGNNPTDATVDNFASVCYKNAGLNRLLGTVQERLLGLSIAVRDEPPRFDGQERR